MRNVATITWLTFHEAWRRWMVVVALLLGVAFVALYWLGLSLIIDDIRQGTRALLLPLAYNFILLAGLYVVHFLTIMLAIFASVDTISGEIASHTIQTVVTKPVPRWAVVLGKWLGFAAMISLYLALLDGGILWVTNMKAGYTPPNALEAAGLLILEALVLLSLSLLAGTRIPTLANGIVLLMLYGITFIGSWVEQIGTVLQSDTAVRLGGWANLILPVEILWRRAAYLMQPPVNVPGNFVSPFGAFTEPGPQFVTYALAYTLVALLLALWSFSRRDL